MRTESDFGEKTESGEKPSMLRILYIPLVIIIMIIPAHVFGGEMAAIMDGWKTLADEAQLGGRIINPQICPADTSWISFEVHTEDEIRLYTYNTRTDELHEVMPSSGSSDLHISNHDLAWYPRKASGDRVWAAFAGNSSGRAELYLYDAVSQSHFQLGSSDLNMGTRGVREPAWSPDGHCLTYTGDAEMSDDIHIICNMNEILDDPENAASSASHITVLSTEANEFGAVWDPVVGSGYFAYHYRHGNNRIEIRIHDLRNSRSYGLQGNGSMRITFAPGWAPNGKQIAYFQDNGDGLKPSQVGLALAEIVPWQDSLSFKLLRGGTALTQTEVTRVAANNYMFRGPAWSPDGRHLLVSSYQPSIDNPFRVIDPSEWKKGRGKPYWMGRFDDNLFDRPLDVTIVERSLAFTFQRDQNRYLCLGQLEPRGYYGQRVISRRVEPDRLDWWDEYSSGGKVSVFAKIGNFLWKPIVGPDIGINKGIVPTAVLGFLVISALTDGGGDSSPERDWRPPGFPGGLNFSIGF
jgi:Tol biopolymer transport system component